MDAIKLLTDIVTAGLFVQGLAVVVSVGVKGYQIAVLMLHEHFDCSEECYYYYF